MRAAPLFLAVVVLAGCAVAPPRPAVVPATYEARRTQLQAVTRFSLEGRLAIAVAQQGVNASINWKQRGSRSDLDLRAPLGFGSAQVMRDGEQMRLKSSRGDSFSGGRATQELTRRLGFAPPLDSLRYWVLGIADPGMPAIETPGDDQRLAALEQDGWRVEYQEYRSFGAGALEALLPRRLTLLREGIRLRLLVERWTVAAP